MEVFDARKSNMLDLGTYQNAEKNEVADNEIFRVLSSGRLDIGKIDGLKHQQGKMFIRIEDRDKLYDMLMNNTSCLNRTSELNGFIISVLQFTCLLVGFTPLKCHFLWHLDRPVE